MKKKTGVYICVCMCQFISVRGKYFSFSQDAKGERGWSDYHIVCGELAELLNFNLQQ